MSQMRAAFFYFFLFIINENTKQKILYERIYDLMNTDSFVF